jgi:hypothetical protein
MGCGSLVFFLPHFLTDHYLPVDVIFNAAATNSDGSDDTQICNLNGRSGDGGDNCVGQSDVAHSLGAYR